MLHAMRSRTGAWRPLAALAVGVLALHAALLSGGSGRVAAPLGLAPAGPVSQVVQLLPRAGPSPAPSPARDAGPGLSGPPTAPGAPVRAGAVVLAQRQDLLQTSAATPAATPGRAAPSAWHVGPGPAAPALPALSALPAAGAEAGPGTQAVIGEEAELIGAEPAPAVASGEPPPLYATRLPAAATLRYALHYYGRSGEAVLSWRPAGAAYTLALQGLPLPLADEPVAPRLPGQPDRVRPLIEQASQGQLDANGLAPDRFTDRRRGRGQRAANFRRELGRIEFSGPSTVQPAWPGAQDRLSWWVQLPAIVAAAAAVPADVRMFVVDARGRGELWRFDHLGLVAGPIGTGLAAVQHWRHEPAQAEGQRVELWLDPAQSHWPVQLRLTSLRTGERFELQLLAIETSPP